MFERGKKEDDLDAAAGFKPTATSRSAESASTRAASRSGECAVIGRSIEINGDVRGNEDLRIEGDVSGTVELRNSNLTIGKEGKVRADVYAKSITVDGTTEGDLYASERVIVHVNANARGNITAPKVGIEEGAKFKGTIDMDQAAVERALSKANMQATLPIGERAPAKSVDVKVAPKNVARETTSSVNPSAGVR
ncbi:MAG TPA: polymer-forming cytoskeletal protein [Woeseiaceae bacterium]